MRLKELWIGLALLLISISLIHRAQAGAQEEIDGAKIRYGLKPGDYVLPPGARELKAENAFPTEEDETNGIYLAQPLGFCASHTGNLFISDIRNSEIYVFDLAGKHLRTIGRFGQGPGEFMMPKELALLGDELFVRDMGQKRLQSLDKFGKYKGGFKLFRDYYSIVVSDKHIYAVPVFYVPPQENSDSCLIDVLDHQGRVTRSFGGLLDVNLYDSMLLNKARLAFTNENELWASFECFPIVRKYSLSGELIAEYRYTYGIVEKKESFNKKMMAQRTKFEQVPYYFINSAIWATAEGLYLLGSSNKRLDILLMSQDGRILEFYWVALDRAYWCNGLFVNRAKDGKKFYVLDSISGRIEQFSIKEIGR